jgi:hypothetical protein
MRRDARVHQWEIGSRVPEVDVKLPVLLNLYAERFTRLGTNRFGWWWLALTHRTAEREEFVDEQELGNSPGLWGMPILPPEDNAVLEEVNQIIKEVRDGR